VDPREDQALLSALFRLEGEDVIRRSNGRTVPAPRHGYTNVSLGRAGSTLGYHRLKFFLLHGWLPSRVDHRDGVKHNNLGSNLRAATQATNMMNQPHVHTRRSLPRGVYLRPSGKFQAKAWDGKRYNVLGMFTTPEAASREVEGFLSQHHGEFYVRPAT